MLSIKKGKYIREFARFCHKNKTQEYFLNIIKFIKKYSFENNFECLAYLYGSICHYVLDSTFHPFVFYKTGVFKKNDKNSHKYNALHTKMESMLDKYFYDKINNKPYIKYKHYEENFPKIQFSKSLKILIDDSFHETYNITNIANIYHKSYKQGKFIFKYGVFDRFGIKKLLYQFIDFIRPKKYKKLKYVSSYIKKIDLNYLNLEHNKWYCSANNKLINLSVDDLYSFSVTKAVNLINNIDKILKNDFEINKIKQIIPNVSYISGKDLKRKYKMHIFEF